jgi:23S rRNA (uracil1939-C5)-methyltransferase
MVEDTIELELTAMAHGGRALGRAGKRTVFVPYTIPGERVLARITQDRGRVAFAEGVRLLEASADRVYPRCAHFGPGRCGLCHWQHIDYDAQILIKQDVLADQLARIGGFDNANVLPVIPSPQIWGYNYHMTMIAGADGQPGFPGVDDERIVLVEECHVIHPDLLALYDTLDLQFDGLRRLRLQIDSLDDRMLILTMADDLAPELHLDVPVSVNMLLSDHEPVSLIGASHSRYQVGQRSFRATAGSFFRANVAQIPHLVDVVLSALDLTGSEAVLDVYGGVGLFSAFIAPHAGLVTLIDSYPPAVTDAESNLDTFDHVDLIEGSAEDVLPGLEDAYDAAMLDPPGEGLSVEVIDTLAQLQIPRLVYISSDPATLARDAQRLCQQGYNLRLVQPIDFAPQMYYIDAAAVLDYGQA